MSAVEAQSLRVQLVDSVSGGQVVGALVAALDAAGVPLSETVTDASGMASLRLSRAGVWRVRVRRIGHRPVVSPAIDVSPSGVHLITMRLPDDTFFLPRVDVISDAARCQRDGAPSLRAATLWEQVVIALRSSTLATASARTPLRTVLFERELDLRLGLVREQITGMTSGKARPFGAIPADSLAARGYVRQELDGGFRFFAPDDSVLVSDSFQSSHCFTAAERADSVGGVWLDFWPRDTTRLANIAGSAVIDSLTGVPRRIDYRYTTPLGLLPARAAQAGGTITLERLPSGEWIVSAFSIRMPLFGVHAASQRVTVRAYKEIAGVAERSRDPAQQRTPLIARDTLAELSVRFVDEQRRPVPNVLVASDSTTSRFSSDTGGVVKLPGVPPAGRALRIRKIGFAPLDTTLRASGSTPTLVLRRVQRLATDSVLATSGLAKRSRFDARFRATAGQFLDSVQVRRRAATFAIDLLQGIPGIQLYRVPADVPAPRDNAELSREWFAGATLPVMTTGTSLNGRGGICLPSLFVDGQRSSVAQFATLDTREVIGVELYPRGTQLPQEFQRGRDDVCGAVAIWTVYSTP